MTNFNRRNTIWLGMLATMLAVVLLVGDVSVATQAVLLALFLFALGATVVNPKLPANLYQTVQSRTQDRVRRSRMSPQAQEAYARAEARGTYRSSKVQLVDIGMITTQSGDDGIVMRRTRSVSKDDDGVRPFVTVQVPNQEAERNAMMRFEIVDHNGEEQHVREMSVYLRSGEMNILSDHHLPLMDNPYVEGMGDWDLRVYIDNGLMGIHNFSLTPSFEDRRARLNRHSKTAPASSTPATPKKIRNSPMSLEDLLRNQGGEGGES